MVPMMELTASLEVPTNTATSFRLQASAGSPMWAPLGLMYGTPEILMHAHFLIYLLKGSVHIGYPEKCDTWLPYTSTSKDIPNLS